MAKLTTEESKTIEGYWLNIQQLRDDLKYRMWDLTENKTTDENIGGGKSNRISDPTAQKAMILADDVRYQFLKKRVDVVDHVYSSLDERMRNFVDARYFCGDANYISWDTVAMKLGIAKQEAFKLRNKLIDETAKKIGWL